MEVLSEHLSQGWLEGYLLTGRHGLFSCYEAFVHMIDSMFNQFSHQDPGFIDPVVNKKADVTRVYLPPDTTGVPTVNRASKSASLNPCWPRW